MLKKIILGVLLFSSTMLFAMTLSNLNSATKSELMKIKGVGSKKADAIISERRKGKFKSIEDLIRVKGVGKKILLNVKNDVTSGKKRAKKQVNKKVRETKKTTTRRVKKTTRRTTDKFKVKTPTRNP